MACVASDLSVEDDHMAEGERIARVEDCAPGADESSGHDASVGFANKHTERKPSTVINFPLRLEFQPGTTLGQVEEVASLLEQHLQGIRRIRHVGPASSDPWNAGPRDLQSSLKIKQLEMLCRDKDQVIARLIEQRQDQTRLMEKLILLLSDKSPKEIGSPKDTVPLRIRVASMLPHSLVRALREVGWLRRLARRLP